jgi:hypothetical protein
MRPSLEEIAWAAGFFDGDGCFSVSISGGWAGAFIGSTDLSLLLKFQDVVGCGRISETQIRRRPGNWSKKHQYTYRAYADVDVVARTLWAVLGEYKRQQAIAALDLIGHRQDAVDSGDALVPYGNSKKRPGTCCTFAGTANVPQGPS